MSGGRHPDDVPPALDCLRLAVAMYRDDLADEPIETAREFLAFVLGDHDDEPPVDPVAAVARKRPLAEFRAEIERGA